MTITRLLPAVVLTATLASGPAFGQYDPRPAGYPGTGRPSASSAPSTLPGGMVPNVPSVQPSGGPDTGGPPAKRGSNPIERISMRSVPGSEPAEPGLPNGTTMPLATPYAGGSGLPPGSYGGPWMGGEKPGCAGPMGGNGPVSYELYALTGVNFVGGSDLTDRLNPGVMAGAGGKSFLYTPDATAAWTIDLGVTYTYNRGKQDDTLFAFNKGSTTTDPIFGTTTTNPPSLQQFRLRALHRTSFNFALGRDWWLWGPGSAGYESGWNLRWGADIGGRWGTAHVDMVPVGEDTGYFRRQATYTGAFLDLHTNWEVPVGGWIWFGGVAAQYGYEWMNIIEPLDSNISNVNLILQTGFRF